MPKPKPIEGLTQEDARKLLKAQSLRCTAARVAILQCLFATSEPLNAATVAEQVTVFGFDKSTIYRALTDLNEAGLVSRLDIGDGPRHFELSPTGDDQHTAHPHFVCTNCERIYCLAPSQVALTTGSGDEALPGEATDVLIKGRCTDCR